MSRYRRAAGIALLIIAAYLAGFGTGGYAGIHHYAPRSCTFDGGGSLVSGDAGRTSDGHVWACDGGQLYKIK